MSKLKKLAGETVLYGLGSIVPRFLNFLLVTLHTDVFNPDAYGVITKLFAWVGVLNTVYMFGMETTYFRFTNKTHTDSNTVYSTTLISVGAVSLLFAIVVLLFLSPISQVMGADYEHMLGKGS
jgi:O-antigen/teichoic acid export membrane protein